MTHYRKFVEPFGGGWSQWQEMGRVTHMACCDCGLVHSMRFKVRLNHRTRTAAIHMKVRQHKTRTKTRRKQARHQFVRRRRPKGRGATMKKEIHTASPYTARLLSVLAKSK